MRKIPKILLLLLLSTSFIFTGCPDPLNPNGVIGPGEMRATATVEGNFFASDATADASGSTYLVKASMDFTFPSNANGHIEMTLNIPKMTPPYTITVQSTPAALIEYCLEESASVCTIFHAKQAIGSGTITITSISPRLEGTFSGTLQQIGGSGSRTITGGEFIANYK